MSSTFVRGDRRLSSTGKGAGCSGSFAHSLLYVLPRDAAAFEAHPGIRALLEERRLALVLWDQHAGFAEFKVSWRGPGWPCRLLAQVPCRQVRLCQCMQFDCSHT